MLLLLVAPVLLRDGRFLSYGICALSPGLLRIVASMETKMAVSKHETRVDEGESLCQECDNHRSRQWIEEVRKMFGLPEPLVNGMGTFRAAVTKIHHPRSRELRNQLL